VWTKFKKGSKYEGVNPTVMSIKKNIENPGGEGFGGDRRNALAKPRKKRKLLGKKEDLPVERLNGGGGWHAKTPNIWWEIFGNAGRSWRQSGKRKLLVFSHPGKGGSC